MLVLSDKLLKCTLKILNFCLFLSKLFCTVLLCSFPHLHCHKSAQLLLFKPVLGGSLILLIISVSWFLKSLNKRTSSRIYLKTSKNWQRMDRFFKGEVFDLVLAFFRTKVMNQTWSFGILGTVIMWSAVMNIKNYHDNRQALVTILIPAPRWYKHSKQTIKKLQYWCILV